MAYPLPPWIQSGVDEQGWKVKERDGVYYISGIVPLHVPEHIELPWNDDLTPRRKSDSAHPGIVPAEDA
jgi:hypothetical protein